MGQMTIEFQIKTLEIINREHEILLTNMKKRFELLTTAIPRTEEMIARNKARIGELKDAAKKDTAQS